MIAADWDRVYLIVGLILTTMLVAEVTWMRQRHQRTAVQNREWRATQASIRRVLGDPTRQVVIADAKLRALSNQAHLNQICQSTATALGAPAAVITVVEYEGQRWLAYYGAEWCDEETRMGLLQPLETSYCKYVVATDKTLVISNSIKDIRVRTNAESTKAAVQAYIGAPVHTADGVPVGSLCVFDHRPRKWSARDRTTVETFAALVRL